MSKKHKNTLNYIENLLSLASWVTGWESISSLVDILTDITSSTV